MNPEHPDFEDLSAYHDGEGPQWTDHVATCAPCRDRVAELAGLSGLIAQTGPERRVGSPAGSASAGSDDDAVGRVVAAVAPEGGAPSTGVEAPRGAGPERPFERGAGPERPFERGAGPERPFERGAGPERPFERGAGPERPFERGAGPERPFERGAGPERPFERGAGPERPFERGAGPERPSERGEGPRRWWMGASVAAMLMFTVAVGALVASRGDQASTPTAVGPGVGNRATTEAGGAGERKAAPVIAVGDLGEISDRAALVARVRADLDAARTSTPSQDQAAAPEAPRAPGSPESLANSAPAGPPPCEAEARRGPGARGEVIYQATAEKDGTPAVVLAFGPSRESDPVTVEVRARSDCRLLLQGAIL